MISTCTANVTSSLAVRVQENSSFHAVLIPIYWALEQRMSKWIFSIIIVNKFVKWSLKHPATLEDWSSLQNSLVLSPFLSFLKIYHHRSIWHSIFICVIFIITSLSQKGYTRTYIKCYYTHDIVYMQAGIACSYTNLH